MNLKLSILGCNSAIPSISRFTTSQVFGTATKNYLIDCGEGAQIRARELKIKTNKIHEIFISHLHGDHFFGLPGFITSLNLSGRTLPLSIFGPKGLKAYLEMLESMGSFHLNFALTIYELDAAKSQLIHEDSGIEVFTIPLKHRIPTTGFLFREKPKPRNIKTESIKEYNLTVPEIKLLKSGEDLLRADGTLLRNIDLTKPPSPPRSYAYCSDTIYDPELVSRISGVSVLYHEATYLHELKEKARERGHSTAFEAGSIASQANVEHLILGHYSSRYKTIDLFREEAESSFHTVSLAEDGAIFEF